jgi:hypothetical protein
MGQERKRVRARPFSTAVAVAVAWSWAVPARAWGPVVHQEVTSKAIETLPKGLRPFYKDHRLELPTLSVEPDIPEEGRERRFAIDKVMKFPFWDVPRDEAQFKAKFPEAGDIGRLPWLIDESYAKLVEAFKSGDKGRILAESDKLAGLVADIENPLALTDNADGQKTEQHGLWVRFSTRLPEAMEKRLKLNGDAAVLLDDPKGYVLSMVNRTYVWVDNILYGDELARRGKSGYTEIYYEAAEERVGIILRDHLSQAANDVGSYWYTAWTAAGRPELK